MNSFEMSNGDLEPGLQAARAAVVEVILELVGLDHRLFEIGQSLRLSWDAVEMWENKAPRDPATELYGTLRWVRTELFEEAISGLRKASHESAADLRFEFRGEANRRSRPDEGGTE